MINHCAILWNEFLMGEIWNHIDIFLPSTAKFLFESQTVDVVLKPFYFIHYIFTQLILWWTFKFLNEISKDLIVYLMIVSLVRAWTVLQGLRNPQRQDITLYFCILGHFKPKNVHYSEKMRERIISSCNFFSCRFIMTFIMIHIWKIWFYGPGIQTMIW